MNQRVMVESEAVVAANPMPFRLDPLLPYYCREGTLTTERAESCQGLPVVVVGGVAYGPADLGPHRLHMSAPPDVIAAALAAGYTVDASEPYEGEDVGLAVLR